MANNKRDKIDDMNSQLVTKDYLDQAFDRFAEEIGATLQMFMLQVDDRFNRIERRLDDHDKKFDQVFQRFDHMLSRMDKYDQEQMFVGRQLNRIDDRVNQLAKHTGYKFKSS